SRSSRGSIVRPLREIEERGPAEPPPALPADSVPSTRGRCQLRRYPPTDELALVATATYNRQRPRTRGEGGSAMPVTVKPVGSCFAAEVEGVDLTRPVSPAEVASIHAGMDTYAVLVFHDQSLDDDHQLAFTKSLGEIEHAIGTSLRAPDEYRLP